jgi:hypothetical protein
VMASYARRYRSEFSNRMKVAGMLRIAAFSPIAAGVVGGILARSPRLASFVLRATRSGNGARGESE